MELIIALNVSLELILVSVCHWMKTFEDSEITDSLSSTCEREIGLNLFPK
jgi:hypothetical protein